MKKYAVIIILLAAAVALCACNTTLPVENSGAEQSGVISAESGAEPASDETPSSAPTVSEESVNAAESSVDPVAESSEEITAEESSEAVSEISAEEPSEESSEETAEESSEEETSAETAKIGELTASYLDIIGSGNYRIRTSETRTVGGEALPYTVTAYHKGDAVYYEIEESYGSKVTYLRKGGKLITLDTFARAAMISDDDGEVFEKKLWTGDITLTGVGTEELFDTQYSYEKYTDSAGFEFTLFFNITDELERYRSYDSTVKDTIVISLSVSGDISGGIFEIPSDYTVIEE